MPAFSSAAISAARSCSISWPSSRCLTSVTQKFSFSFMDPVYQETPEHANETARPRLNRGRAVACLPGWLVCGLLRLAPASRGRTGETLRPVALPACAASGQHVQPVGELL